MEFLRRFSNIAQNVANFYVFFYVMSCLQGIAHSSYIMCDKRNTATFREREKWMKFGKNIEKEKETRNRRRQLGVDLSVLCIK
jgi:hypothetical protein